MIMKTKAATHPRGNNIWHIIILKHSPNKFDNPDPHPNQLQSIGVSMSIVVATFLMAIFQDLSDNGRTKSWIIRDHDQPATVYHHEMIMNIYDNYRTPAQSIQILDDL